jgi:hypothetical protein
VVVERIGEMHEWYDQPSFLEATDRSLQTLGNFSLKTKHVMFAFGQGWVDAHGLLPERKQSVQAVCKSFQLQPLGFVVITEALTTLLREKTTHLHAIVVEVTQDVLSFMVVQHGKIAPAVTIGRSGDAVSDFREAFAQLRERPLPERLIVYTPVRDAAEYQKWCDDVFVHDWVKEECFVRPPTLEFMQTQDLVSQVIAAGGKAIVGSHATPTVSVPAVSTPAPVSTSLTPFITQQYAAPTFGVPVFQEKPLQPKQRNYAKWVATGVVLGLCVTCLAGVTYGSLGRRAVVTMVFPAQPYTGELTLPFCTTETTIAIPQAGCIQAQRISLTKEGHDELVTTQSEQVGKYAAGTVTLYNFTDAQKTFVKGTKLLAKNNVHFTLTEEVKVGAATTVQTTPTSPKQITPTTSSGRVTATDLGDKGNLAKGSELTVESFAHDTYLATADVITGGESKEVLVVSQKDHDRLRNKLSSELTKQATTELQKRDSKTELFFLHGPAEVTDAQPSAKVGAQADRLSMQLSVKQSVWQVAQSDVRTTALRAFTATLQPGQMLLTHKAELSVQYVGQVGADATTRSLSQTTLVKPTTATATTTTHPGLLIRLRGATAPHVDQSTVKHSLTNKTQSDVERLLLAAFPGVRVMTAITPRLHTWHWPTLPSNPEKIILYTDTE